MRPVVRDDSTSIADWLTAGGAVASTLIVLGAAILAWWSLRDARRTRHAQLVLQINDQWADLSSAFKLYWKYGRDQVTVLVDKLYGHGPSITLEEQNDYEQLRASVNLIETVGVLRETKAMTTDVIYQMWGGSVYAVWLAWESALPRLREYTREPDLLHGFEALSRDIQGMVEKRAEGLPAPRGGATEEASASQVKEGVAPGRNARKGSSLLSSLVSDGSGSSVRRIGLVLLSLVVAIFALIRRLRHH